MKRVTGIGGLFFKTKNVPKIKDWYRDHLGFGTTEWGATFVWGDQDKNKKGVSRTEWSPFKSDTDYFAPSDHPYMFNYRVANLEELMDVLKKEGVKTIGDIQKFEYGNFGWILDPENRKIELWQPVDDKFGDDPQVWTDRVTGLGGVFFKSENPKELKEWYARHLGIAGETFHWVDLSNPKAKELAQTVWQPFKNDTDYFAPSDKPFMFNYRVKDLESLLKKLKSESIEQVGKVDDYPYGKFAWIMDPDGTKIELWEPKDDAEPGNEGGAFSAGH